jgi:hypothetical protein
MGKGKDPELEPDLEPDPDPYLYTSGSGSVRPKNMIPNTVTYCTFFAATRILFP